MNIEKLKQEISNIYGGYIKEYTDKIIELLKDILNQKNYDINNIKIIGSGESSLVLECSEEVIKLTLMEYDNHKSLKEYVSHSKYILQPNEEYIINLNYDSLKILFLPKLTLGDISSEDVLNMYCNLRDDGYLWSDTKLENIGKDKNGNCLLLDYGELIYIKDMPLYKQNSELEGHRIRRTELDQMYLETKKQNSEQLTESGMRL